MAACFAITCVAAVVLACLRRRPGGEEPDELRRKFVAARSLPARRTGFAPTLHVAAERASGPTFSPADVDEEAGLEEYIMEHGGEEPRRRFWPFGRGVASDGEDVDREDERVRRRETLSDRRRSKRQVPDWQVRSYSRTHTGRPPWQRAGPVDDAAVAAEAVGPDRQFVSDMSDAELQAVLRARASAANELQSFKLDGMEKKMAKTVAWFGHQLEEMDLGGLPASVIKDKVKVLMPGSKPDGRKSDITALAKVTAMGQTCKVVVENAANVNAVKAAVSAYLSRPCVDVADEPNTFTVRYPTVTAEDKGQAIKTIKGLAEKARMALREERHAKLSQLRNEPGLSQNARVLNEEEVQRITDKYTDAVAAGATDLIGSLVTQ